MHEHAAEELADILLRMDEGERLQMYLCPAQKWTIGVGHNLQDRGISKAASAFILAEDIQECVEDLSTFSWYKGMTTRRQAAMINMRFWFGYRRFRLFRNMLQALESGDWAKAGAEIEDSLAARQTPGGKLRCQRLRRMVEEG